MNEFIWTGITQSGQKSTGTLLAENKKEAGNQLREKNIFPTSIKKKNFLFKKNNPLSHKQRLYFFQQLQLLLQSGLSLTDAILVIAKTTPHIAIQTMAHQLNEHLMKGLSFSTALSHFPNEFNQTTCQLIASGEHSGQLGITLSECITDLTLYLQTKNKLFKILFYPLSVLFVSFFICIGLLIFVIPQFQSIYNSFGAQLPTLTHYFITLSDVLRKKGFTIFLAATCLIIAIVFTIKKNIRLKKKIIGFAVALPIIHSLVMSKQIGRWSQLMAMTLSSGIPLIDALSLAENALFYNQLIKQLVVVKKAVVAGKSLHTALMLYSDFPDDAKTMIGIGENADSLNFVMEKIAAIYAQLFNDKLERLSKLLEPVIMILVASIVSSIIIAMYLPIFKMGNVI